MSHKIFASFFPESNMISTLKFFWSQWLLGIIFLMRRIFYRHNFDRDLIIRGTLQYNGTILSTIKINAQNKDRRFPVHCNIMYVEVSVTITYYREVWAL